jgi:hypothetical protein
MHFSKVMNMQEVTTRRVASQWQRQKFNFFPQPQSDADSKVPLHPTAIVHAFCTTGSSSSNSSIS